MSNADPAEVSMVVSRDGVTVEKSFEPDDFPVPAIAFVIRSERDESVSVRLTDEVPEQVDAEDIGFHPKYGAEFWSVEGEIIVFDREFEAGEEYTTVYGLRASQTDDVESYLGEPTIDDVDPPSDDSGQAVRDVIGDDGEEIDLDSPSDDDIEAAIAAADEASEERTPEEDDASADDEDEAVEPLHLNDPNEGGDVEPERPTTASSGDSTDDADPVTVDAGADGDLAAALASQIRAGDASEGDVAALRRAFAAGGDGSTDARIKQLQSEVADLRAYTNALEEFLDESGEGMELVQDLQDDVQGLESELATVRTRADEAVERADAVEEGFEDVGGEIDDLSEDVSAAVDRVDAVEETVSDVDDAVESVESAVEGMRDDLSAVESEMDDVHENVDEVSADVADVVESLDDVEDLDDRLASLEDEFDEAREDLQALSEMREQLSSVFGAQVQADEGADDE